MWCSTVPSLSLRGRQTSFTLLVFVILQAISYAATLPALASPVYYNQARQAIAIDTYYGGGNDTVWFDFFPGDKTSGVISQNGWHRDYGYTTQPGLNYRPDPWSGYAGWAETLGNLNSVSQYSSNVNSTCCYPPDHGFHYFADEWNVGQGKTTLYVQPTETNGSSIPVTPNMLGDFTYSSFEYGDNIRLVPEINLVHLAGTEPLPSTGAGSTVTVAYDAEQKNSSIADIQARLDKTGLRQAVFSGDSVEFSPLTDDARFDPARDTYVLVHGWVPANNSDSDAELDVELEGTWVPNAALSLKNHYGSDINVLAYDWTAMAGGQGTDIVPNNLVPSTGLSLSSQYQAWLPDESAAPTLFPPTVQLIGHSLGAGVVTEAALNLANNGVVIDTVTLLDAPADDLSILIGGKVFLQKKITELVRYGIQVENYYGRTDLLAYGVPYFGADNHPILSDNHSEVRDTYFSNLEHEWENVQLTGPGSTVPIQEAIVPFSSGSSYFYSESGTGGADSYHDFCGDTGLLCEGLMLTSGSPIRVYYPLAMTPGLLGVSFDFLPIDLQEGDSFAVFMNDTLAFFLGWSLFSAETTSTGFIDLTSFEYDETVLFDMVMSSDRAGSQMVVWSPNHYFSEASVPAPLFTIILGLIALAFVKKRGKKGGKPGTDHGILISTLDWQLKLIVVGCLFPRSSGLAGPGTAADHRKKGASAAWQGRVF